MGDPKPLAILAIVLAAALNVPHAMAAPDDEFQKFKAEAMDTLVDRHRPFGGLTTVAALSRVWSVSTFYTVWSGSGASRTPHWVVRRASGGMRTTPSVGWADSRTCPAVRPMLEKLAATPAPAADIPGLSSPRELSLVLDGEYYELWVNGAVYPNGASGGLRTDGNVDSPIAAWWQAALPTLKTCWSETAPS